MVLPRAERILRLLCGVIILLVHERAGVGDNAPEQVGPEPTHAQGGRAAGAAADHRVTPGVGGKSKFRIRGLNVGVGPHGGQHFIGDEAGQPVGHGVIFEAALAVLAVVAAVLDCDGDEGRQLAGRVFGNGEIIERVAHKLHLAGAVVNDQERSRRAVLVGSRHIDGNLSLRSHRLLRRLQRRVVAPENFAIRELHFELEEFPLGMTKVGEIRSGRVFGTDGDVAVAIGAGILGVSFRPRGAGQHAEKADEGKENSEGCSACAVHARVVRARDPGINTSVKPSAAPSAATRAIPTGG